jgi:hypothetical protein
MNDSAPLAVEISPISMRGSRRSSVDRILHPLQPRLLRVSLIRLEEEVASAREIEAEVDLVLR